MALETRLTFKTKEDVAAACSSIRGDATPTVEESIVSAFAEMRELAARSAARSAETGDDDRSERWKREVLDRRPLYVMGVIGASSLHLWVTEPPMPGVPNLSAEFTLHADVHHFTWADGTRRDSGTAELVVDTKAHTDAALALGWLYREIHGVFPTPQRSDASEDVGA